MKLKQGFSAVLPVIVILVLIGGGLYVWQKGKLSNNDYNVADVPDQPIVADETKDWQTYRNEEYGFEFKYPNNLQIVNAADLEGGYNRSSGFDYFYHFADASSKFEIPDYAEGPLTGMYFYVKPGDVTLSAGQFRKYCENQAQITTPCLDFKQTNFKISNLEGVKVSATRDTPLYRAFETEIYIQLDSNTELTFATYENSSGVVFPLNDHNLSAELTQILSTFKFTN